MFWKRSGVAGAEKSREERAFRRLLAAAGTEPSALPEPSPYFMARVKARIAERMRETAAHPIGAVAWQMLPALVIVLAVLGAYTGYESHRASRAQEAAMTRMLESPDASGDLFLAVAFLGGGAGMPSGAGGQ